MSDRALVLEVLSGPLDGHTIRLEDNVEWTCAGDGPLAFPWDEELGHPQARFVRADQGWQLQAMRSPHGTYRLNREERLEEGAVLLNAGDLLKASRTWLLVREV